MAQPAHQFEVVEIPEVDPTPPKQDDTATNMIMLALRSLSQRAMIAIESLFTLITVFSAFVLWYKIPNPNEFQIVALALYALFVLAANWIVRRK